MMRPRWPHLPLGRSRQAGLDILGQISPSGGRPERHGTGLSRRQNHRNRKFVKLVV